MAKPVVDDAQWQEWQEWTKRKQLAEFLQWQETRDPQFEQRTTLEAESSTKEHTKYVLSGQPTGWAAMDKALRDYDDEKVKDYKEDIDNLLTFTGLFSGVLASFLIESYPKLLASPSGGTSSDLRQLIAQAVHNELQGNRSAAATSPHPSSPFHPAGGDIRVNVLWFASLLLSLIAASFGILVKQWLREYMSFKNPSPQARLRIRHLRYPALDRWWVFQIAAFLPILVHLSLALFFVGLVYFTASVHSSIEYTALPLVSAWGLCFAVFALLPFLLPRCPYRITLLTAIYACIHRFFGRRFSSIQRWIAQRLPGAEARVAADESKIQQQKVKQTIWSYLAKSWWGLCHRCFKALAHACDRVDEVNVISSENKDLKVLSEADSIQSNDELLETEIAEAVRQVDLQEAQPHVVPKFIRSLLSNRLAIPQEDDDDDCFALLVDLRKTTLSVRARKAIISIIYEFLPRMRPSYHTLSEVAMAEIDTRDDLQAEARFFRPRFLFALLLCLSGAPFGHMKPLVERLRHPKRGADIDALCQDVITKSASQSNLIRSPGQRFEPQNVIHINLLHGLSLLYRTVEARWSLSQALHVDTKLGMHREWFDMKQVVSVASPGPPPPAGSSKSLRVIPDPKYMAFLGSRGMHHMVLYRLSTISSDRAVVEDVLESLCVEVQNYTTRRRANSADSATSHNSAAEDTLVVDQIELDSVVTYICFQACHPQWYQLEKHWSRLLPNLLCTPEERTLCLAICSIPTLGILRLCCRAANHSHSFGAKIIEGMNLETFFNWDNALQHCLKHNLIRSDTTYILKLLAFSVYLYTFGTPRLQSIPKAEKRAWEKIFHQFTGEITTALEGLHVQDMLCNDSKHRHHRTPWSTLATVCLEIIRFEEVLARILHSGWSVDVDDLPRAKDRRQDYFRFRYTPNRDVNLDVIGGWKSSEFNSVFSRPLVDALEHLAGPSWSNGFNPPATNASIKFHEYCAQYEKRIGDLLKLRNEEDVRTWLHGYCSKSSKAYTMMARSRHQSS